MAANNRATPGVTKQRHAFSIGAYHEHFNIKDANNRLSHQVYFERHPDEGTPRWYAVAMEGKTTGKPAEDGYDTFTDNVTLRYILYTFCHVGFVDGMPLDEFLASIEPKKVDQAA